MAHFARQKRQSRFYWTELGFLALGLVGLQPSLFTNFLAGSQSKLSSYQQAFHNQEFAYYPAFDSYRDWTSTQLYAQQLGYVGTGSNPYNLSYAPQSANDYPQQQYIQSMQQTVPNAWQNQAAYHAATGNGYTNPNVSGYGNWLSSQSTDYGSNPGSYQPNAAYYPNTNIGTSSYGGLTPRLSQQPLFESSYNTNYRTGTASTGSAAQSYPYLPNTTGSGAWRPYRPATSIYR